MGSTNQESGGFLRNREAQRLSGKSAAALYRLVAIGQLEARLVPGEPISFSREGLLKIAAQRGRDVG